MDVFLKNTVSVDDISRLPLQFSSQSVLVQQSSVVRPQFLDHFVASQLILSILGVQIESVEQLHPLLPLVIFLLHQMAVGPFVMPRIRRMEPNHIQPFPGQSRPIGHQHPVHVLIVSPRPHEVINPAVGLIHPKLGIVPLIAHVGVAFIKLGKDHSLVGDLASQDEGVAAESPLLSVGGVAVLSVFGGAPEEHDFAHVVEEAGELKPVGVACFADSFGGLQEVEKVWQIQIRITGIHVILQLLQSLLNRHHPSKLAILERVLLLHLLVEFHRLKGSHVSVVLDDSGGTGGVIVSAEFGEFFGAGVGLDGLEVGWDFDIWLSLFSLSLIDCGGRNFGGHHGFCA
mmetsp:Transcript_22982/g.48566  ORF Transcript_22982/g.48566 Transcript_22982/m.48566 type:complete len:343 (-) Transcript_22982:234-1262(-)